MIQISLVLFPQFLTLLLIKLLLALGDLLPVSADLHHVLPQGHTLKFPTRLQIPVEFLILIHGRLIGLSMEFHPLGKIGFRGRLHFPPMTLKLRLGSVQVPLDGIKFLGVLE